MIQDRQASDPDLSPGSAWPIYKGVEPSQPDQVIVITTTQGLDFGRTMIDGEVASHFGFQLRFRARDDVVGYQKAMAVRSWMQRQVYADNITLDSTIYLIPCFSGIGQVLELGRDRPPTGRYICTLNAVVPIRVTPPPPPPPPPLAHFGYLLPQYPTQQVHSWSEALVLATGSLYVGGTMDESGVYTGQSSLAGCKFVCTVQKYTDAGILDYNFGTFGTWRYWHGGEDDELSGLHVQADGKLLVGMMSWTTTPSNSQKLYLMRIDGTTGLIDRFFGDRLANNRVTIYTNTFRNQAIVVHTQAAGQTTGCGEKPIVVYNEVVTIGADRIAFGRYQPNGGVDTTWGPTTIQAGLTIHQPPYKIQPKNHDCALSGYYGHNYVQASDGKYVVSGTHDISGGGNRVAAAFRVLADGSGTDSLFGANLGLNFQGSDSIFGATVDPGRGDAIFAGIITLSSGRLLAVGDTANGATRAGLMAMMTSVGAPYTTFNGTGNVTFTLGSLPSNFLFQPAAKTDESVLYAGGFCGDTNQTTIPSTHGLLVGRNADGSANSVLEVATGTTPANLHLIFDILEVTSASTFTVSGHQQYENTTVARSMIRRYAAGAPDLTFGDVSPTVTRPTAPTVVISSVDGVSSGSVTISGTVNPNGTTTIARLEIGQTDNYGHFRSGDFACGAGVSPVAVTLVINGLDSNTLYHGRLTALADSNPTGYGSVGVSGDMTFTTSAGTLTILDETFTGINSTDVRDHQAQTDRTGAQWHTVKGIGQIQSNKLQFMSDPGSGAGNKALIVQKDVRVAAVSADLFGLVFNGGNDGNQTFQGVYINAPHHGDGDGALSDGLYAAYVNGGLFGIFSRVGGSNTTLASLSFTPSVGASVDIHVNHDNAGHATATISSSTVTLTTSAVPSQLFNNTEAGIAFSYGLGDTVNRIRVTTP